MHFQSYSACVHVELLSAIEIYSRGKVNMDRQLYVKYSSL